MKAEREPIADQTIRIHVKKTQKENKGNSGLWTGDDVKPSRKLADRCPIPLGYQRQIATAII